jgi:hypothetical protein
MYFFWVIFLFSDRSSVPVVLLIVFVACGVTLGVLFVLFCLFCSSFFCLSGDFNGLVGFDRAMFVDYKNYLLWLEVGLGL